MSGLLVIGGGPAGLSAAAGYREAGGRDDVVILTADVSAPYARPPLTKDYLRGDSGAEVLPLVDDGWYTDHGVRLELSTAATRIDPASRLVETTDGQMYRYDRLCLCTGAAPQPMPVPGADSPDVLLVRTRQSGDALRGLTGPGHRVAVLGSGFIGCEAAASLSMTGASVVLITDEQTPHAARLGTEAGRRISAWLTETGVELVLGDAVRQVAPTEPGSAVVLTSGRVIHVDRVVSGGGIAPQSQLAQDAGLQMENGRVVVDSAMRTSAEDVWAAGDVVWAHNDAAGRSLAVEHWGEAETMGMVAGRSAAGAPEHWNKVPGFWSTIGRHTIKYAAWGDGFDTAHLVEGPDGWAVWYGLDGITVGILTSEWDSVYDYGRDVVERHAPVEEVVSSRRSPGRRGS